jgi:F-type H+-transporting ATPase subunit gamma
MAKTRELKRRIRSLGKTKQITRTMELVATARMKKTQNRLLSARPFVEKMWGILEGVNLDEYAARFPLLQEREEVRRVALLVVTANRGLCGAFNANVIRLARSEVAEIQSAGAESELHVVGKKGKSVLGYRGYNVVSSRVDIGDEPTYEQSAEIAALFIDKFLSGEIDELRVVYASYKSVAHHPPAVRKILPLRMEASEGNKSVDFLLEPSPSEILTVLLPRIVESRVYQVLLESAAGEQAARRIAMKNATDNAEELIRILTRKYNRARQALITEELSEIVGAADALA